MTRRSVEWSDWQDLGAAVPTAPGVYQVRSCRPGGAGHTLPRLLAEDVEGTLIIGQSSNLERRRRAFQRRIRVGRGHSEANLLHRLRDAFRSHAKAGVLAQVEWRVAITDEPTTVEEQLIKAYVLTFGEPPPLNAAIPNRYGDW